MTGRTEDPRDPGLYDRLMGEAGRAGVAGHFRHLGLVPYEDVFGLNAAADALINPSLFEGWSTTVEEAKALGTRTLLSDISLHREQAPDALFFGPHDPRVLADLLLDIAKAPAWERAPVPVLRAAHAARRRDYADALEAVFRKAVG
jgi:glycosyltransferase involved in cell wall biosynthesis